MVKREQIENLEETLGFIYDELKLEVKKDVKKAQAHM